VNAATPHQKKLASEQSRQILTTAKNACVVQTTTREETSMSLRRTTILWSLSMLVLTACTPREQDTAADADALSALHRKAAELHAAANAAGWSDLFAEGAILMPVDAPAVTTKDGIRAYAQRQYDAYVSNLTIEPVEIEICDDWAWSRTVVTGTMTPKAGGDAIQVDFKEIAVWRREPGGAWKVWRLIGNNNGPSAFLSPTPE
jgi:ketosteroid isomerase-like protein